MKADILELRYRRPTAMDKGHRQIIFNRKVLGYFLKGMDLRGYMMWYVEWNNAPYENCRFEGSHQGRKNMIEYIGNTLKRKGRTVLISES